MERTNNIKASASTFVTRTDLINNYVADIRKYPKLDAAEERELFVKYENETDPKKKDAIRSEIITRNQRFVYAIAKHYSAGDILPDLISEGNIGLLKAFEDYDYRKDNRFCSFAVWHIRREINAYFLNENLLVRATNNAKISPKIKKITDKFYAENGRMPIEEELMDILKDDFDIEVANTYDVVGTTIEHIDAAISDEDNATMETSSEFAIATASYNAYMEQMDAEDTKYRLDNALKVLTDREKTVILMAAGIGYDREYKNAEIGEAMGLSAERVRQLRILAAEKMKKAYISAI